MSGLTNNPAASASATTCPAPKAAISLALVVEAVREGESVLFPGQQADTLADRLQENRGVAEARQVGEPCKIFNDLFDRYVIAAPQGHAVELHSQKSGSEARHQKFIAFQFLARPDRQRILARQSDGRPLDRGIGTGLNGDQEPLVGFRQPCRHSAGRSVRWVSACLT